MTFYRYGIWAYEAASHPHPPYLKLFCRHLHVWVYRGTLTTLGPISGLRSLAARILLPLYLAASLAWPYGLTFLRKYLDAIIHKFLFLFLKQIWCFWKIANEWQSTQQMRLLYLNCCEAICFCVATASESAMPCISMLRKLTKSYLRVRKIWNRFSIPRNSDTTNGHVDDIRL